MNDWKARLDQVKSDTQDGTQNSNTTFPHTAAELGDYALIIVKGPDAHKFLQGQCTCDFALLEQNRAILGAHCNPKGRMISSFLAAKLGHETIGLRMHSSIAEKALEGLKKYIIFSKASIEISTHYTIIGICKNTDAEETTTDTSPTISVTQLNTNQHQGNSAEAPIIQLSHNARQTELWVHLDALANIPLNPSNYVFLSHSNHWQRENIRHGIAEVTIGFVEQLLPQELNYQILDAISFSKGCYTGQEIIARLHYKGSLKKHLYRAAITGAETLALGARVASASPTSKSSGVIIAQTLIEGGSSYEALILCDDVLTADKSFRIDEQDEANIEWLPLPYAIN